MRAALAIALLSELLAARAVGNARRGVDCLFSIGASAGDTCDSFAAAWGTSVDQLELLNPGLDCTNFDTSAVYCIAGTVTPDAPSQSSTTTSTSSTTSNASQPAPTSNIPSPTQPGIAANCDGFYKVASGDQCGIIEAKYGITNDQFSAWNPYIDAQCSNLWVDYYVCVHVPGAAPPSSTSTPSQPAPTGGAPSPTQPGIAPNCDTYYKVASGDQCGTIEARYGISAAQFSQWNPYIDSSCSNLWVDYYVCVHVPGATAPSPSPSPSPSPTPSGPQPQMPNTISTCRAFHQVVSGDSCAVIDAAANISLANFLKWNPFVDANCDNLWLGYYVCVGA